MGFALIRGGQGSSSGGISGVSGVSGGRRSSARGGAGLGLGAGGGGLGAGGARAVSWGSSCSVLGGVRRRFGATSGWGEAPAHPLGGQQLLDTCFR